MKITLTERFQAGVKTLAAVERAALMDAILGLPRAFAAPRPYRCVLFRSGQRYVVLRGR